MVYRLTVPPTVELTVLWQLVVQFEVWQLIVGVVWILEPTGPLTVLAI